MLSPGGRALPGTLLGQRLQAQPGAKGASWRHTSLRSGGRRGQTGKAAALGKDCRASDTRNPEQTVTTEVRGLLRTQRLVGWRERRRRAHDRVHAAEHLSWRPGRRRAGWRGGRSR